MRFKVDENLPEKARIRPHVLEVSSRLVASLGIRELQNQLWIVEEARIRVRP